MRESYYKYAESAINLTTDIIDKHGPRVSGTESCYSACAELETILSKYCTKIKRESFNLHPNSLFAIGKIFALIYLTGLIAILINTKISISIGLISVFTGTIYFISQFILYLDIFDGLFKKAIGNNIIGIIEPKSTVRQQVIIVSHHDSSPVYSFYEKLPLLFPFRLFVPVFLYIFCLLFLLVSFGFFIFNGSILLIPIWIKYVLLFGAIAVFPMYGYISKRQSPGAGDNLIGCTIGIKLAEVFQKAENVLSDTRIIILFTDGEEVGQKGAKYFIKNNAVLLKETRTTVVNIDTIYEAEDIALVKRDRNGFTILSNDLINDIKKVASDLGHEFKTISIPFGGGGTDGGQFARRKIKTASIIGTPTNAFRKNILFHTMNDSADKISKKAVSSVIATISEYLNKFDSESNL